MKELQEILKKTSNFAPDEKAILATVVDVQGSGYRRAGARMLIDENGQAIGTVSGGCLEADVLEHARKVLESSEATVITYDTTKDETSLFGLGMGCRGIVRVLLEPIDKDFFFTRALEISFENRERQFLATLISSKNDSALGGRIYYDEVEQFYYENLPNILIESKEVFNDCLKYYLQEKPSEIRKYIIGENEFELFFENISPPLNLWLFGAGYDAIPLIKFAKELGWRVSVVDHRSAFANAERLPEADEITVSRTEDLSQEFFTDKNSVAVVMTHNYERDCEILPCLLYSNCQYVGVLGPKARTEKILKESGKTFSNEQLAKLYAPIGLDIGANSPEAIALSIIAEINAVLANRGGGFLRHREGSIYER